MNKLSTRTSAITCHLVGQLRFYSVFTATLLSFGTCMAQNKETIDAPLPCFSASSCASVADSSYPISQNVNTAVSAALLLQMSKKLDQMALSLQKNDEAISALLTANKTTADAILKQGDTFNSVILATVSDRFQQLPSELRETDAFKQLKADILALVDQKIAALHPNVANVPASGPAAAHIHRRRPELVATVRTVKRVAPKTKAQPIVEER